MTTYDDFMTEATGVTDPAVLAEIEDVMRNVIFHSTLDWQTRAQLKRAAKQAYAVVQELAANPEAYGLTAETT